MIQNMNQSRVHFVDNLSARTSRGKTWQVLFLLATIIAILSLTLLMIAAIGAGRFVSSRGPVIRSLATRDRDVTVSCSPVRFIRLVGPVSKGRRLAAADGASLTEAAFTVPDDWAHARIEIEDEAGRRAWTNALFA